MSIQGTKGTNNEVKERRSPFDTGNKWPSVLHSHKCAECGLDRTCMTINCRFRPMDVDRRAGGERWVCCFCKETDQIW